MRRLTNWLARNAFGIGCAIGILLAPTIAPVLESRAMGATCPVNTVVIQEIVCVPPVPLQGDPDDHLFDLNGAIYADLFGVDPADAYTVLLAEEPDECGPYTASAGPGLTLLLTVAQTILVDLNPNGTELSAEQAAFFANNDVEVRAIAGLAESAALSLWVGALVFSTDTSIGRRHVVVFGSSAPYADETVYLPDTCEPCQAAPNFGGGGGGQNSPGGPDPARCQELLDGCKDDFLSSMDVCNGVVAACLVAVAACVAAAIAAFWACVFSGGIACVGLGWLAGLCGSLSVGACLAAYAICMAIAAAAYAACLARVSLDPACEGLVWDLPAAFRR